MKIKQTSVKNKEYFKIYVAQISVESKNILLNFNKITEFINNALKMKAHLIVFPELSLPGYLNGDAWECSTFLKECETYHKKIAKLSKNIDILFGSVGIDWKKKNEDGRVRKYNAAFFAHKGRYLKNKKTGFYFWPKTLLPQYREFDDARHFFDLRKLAFEKKCQLIDLYEPIVTTYLNQKIHIGLSICEDAWDENYSFSPIQIFSKQYKHDIFINLSASPFTLNKNNKRDKIFLSHTKKTKTPFVYVNCFGTQNIGKTIYVFDGSSKIYTNHKKQIISAKFCAEDSLIFNYHLKNQCIVNPINNNIDNAYKNCDLNSFSSTAQKILETAIQLNCTKWNISKVVIGVSGGIDSALTSVLFTRVLGKKNVYLINMPTQFNAQITKTAAKKLAENLGCHYAIIPIEDFAKSKFDVCQTVIFQNKDHQTRVELNELNYENIQARERGSGVLAMIASALGAVFSCNTNKSEMTVGYGTLYGDLAGFLCPIGDLWKHQVYALARYYNDNVFQDEVIPNEIFNLPPSAELSAHQDVTKGLGDPLNYNYHDHLFAAWVEHWERKTNLDCLQAYKNNTIDDVLKIKCGTTKTLFPTFEEFSADLNRWWNLFCGIGSIKRVQTPPIIALSKRSFGFDYRESI